MKKRFAASVQNAATFSRHDTEGKIMKISVVITNCTIHPCKGVPFLGYCVELVFCGISSRIVLETASKHNAEKTAEWYANNYKCEIERYYHD